MGKLRWFNRMEKLHDHFVFPLNENVFNLILEHKCLKNSIFINY